MPLPLYTRPTVLGFWWTTGINRHDLNMLANALFQQGTWSENALNITHAWLGTQLSKKIDSIDWSLARSDVQRFLTHSEQDALRNWEIPMFK